MAATPLFAVLFMGVVALLASIGMFGNFEDDGTRLVLAFVAAVVWGFMGMSSFDVYVDDAATVSEPIVPLAYLGLAFAGVTALLGVSYLFGTIQSRASGVSPDDLFGG